jgi:hypothetical protein
VVGRRIFLLGNVWPNFRQLGVQFNVHFLTLRYFIFREDGVYRALRLTQSTVDALIGVNNQKVRAFVETVYGANFYTVSVFTLNAVISNDKSHAVSSTNI